MNEFELIHRYFHQKDFQQHVENQLGLSIEKTIGDDGSLINLGAHQLVQSIDTLIETVHFPKDTEPYKIGFRALSVSLSDLAAMGAQPHSFFLALTLPNATSSWLEQFSKGLFACAEKYRVVLLGGDTTKGTQLTITIHVQGFIFSGKKPLMRSKAQVDDTIYVSGFLGDAAGALPWIIDKSKKNTDDKSVKQLTERYYYPEARIDLGHWLVENNASAAIDISDGLLADLNHILDASSVGAVIDSRKIPLSKSLLSLYSKEQCLQYALTGGDDYELCFCWPSDKPFPNLCPCKVTKIGKIKADLGCSDYNGKISHMQPLGYQHF